MEPFITIKEASELVGKVEMTIRRAVKKAPDNMKSTDEQGRLLIDQSYITSIYKVQSNVTIQEGSNNDVTMLALTKTIDSLNTRLSEANQIIGSQHKELSEVNKKLLEAKATDNDGEVQELIETVHNLESKLEAKETDNDGEVKELIKTVHSLETKLEAKETDNDGEVKELIKTVHGLESKLEAKETDNDGEVKELIKTVHSLESKLEAKETDNDGEVKELKETIKKLEHELSLPIEYEPIKKPFPLMEVVSVVLSTIVVGAFIYFMANQ